MGGNEVQSEKELLMKESAGRGEDVERVKLESKIPPRLEGRGSLI